MKKDMKPGDRYQDANGKWWVRRGRASQSLAEKQAFLEGNADLLDEATRGSGVVCDIPTRDEIYQTMRTIAWLDGLGKRDV